ncbi:hypothetical protein M3Y97_00249400 [Aphelenchoides bicaudatus]|nr:hypothetical protein M3Y97_00249400 [Aphelenchoides bicaudatus]
MSAFVGLGLALLLVFSAYDVNSLEADDSTRYLIIRQFLDKYQPALLIHPAARRFRRFDTGSFDVEPEDGPRLIKRNNAEIVNHILKNYGGIERLGDVGR